VRVALYTIEQARQHLQAWLDADLALATGKEYSVSGRRLVRSEVDERIRFWSQQVTRLEGGTRINRVVPYDL
jgi:hypothetical protein